MLVVAQGIATVVRFLTLHAMMARGTAPARPRAGADPRPAARPRLDDVATERVELDVDGRTVSISNPQRVYFSARGETKLDLAHYYLAVGDGIVNALRHRPCMLHRFPDGVDGEKVHQKRLPKGRRRGSRPCACTSRATTATPTSSASTTSPTSSGPCRCRPSSSTPGTPARDDVESPDEWRIDLDPMPLATFADVRQTAGVVHEVLDELGATGYPKTSGGKGMHVYVRIPPDHGFADVRRAAWAFAREVERRSAGGVDTDLVAQGPRPGRDLRRLQPERPRPHDRQRLLGPGHPGGPRLRPGHLGRDRRRRPARLHHRDDAGPVRRLGDLHADIDDHPYAIDELLEWADRDERDSGAAPAEPA